FTAPAAVVSAPATASRGGRAAISAATPPIQSSTVSASLCAPPTTWTSTSGLRPTASAGRRGSRPSRRAHHQTSTTTPRLASAATAFRVQNATGMLVLASGRVSTVNSGPYKVVKSFEPANGNTGSAGTSDGLCRYGLRSWTTSSRAYAT